MRTRKMRRSGRRSGRGRRRRGRRVGSDAGVGVDGGTERKTKSHSAGLRAIWRGRLAAGRWWVGGRGRCARFLRRGRVGTTGRRQAETEGEAGRFDRGGGCHRRVQDPRRPSREPWPCCSLCGGHGRTAGSAGRSRGARRDPGGGG